MISDSSNAGFHYQNTAFSMGCVVYLIFGECLVPRVYQNTVIPNLIMSERVFICTHFDSFNWDDSRSDARKDFERKATAATC